MQKPLLISLLFAAMVVTGTSAAYGQADVRINEIYYAGTSASEDWIELKNVGNEAIDVSDYFLYSVNDFARLSSLQQVSGDNLNVQPGGIIVVESWKDLNDSLADLSLHPDQDFNNPQKMLDFVRWGGGTLPRTDLAEQAGVWEVNTSLPIADASESNQWLGTDSGGGRVTQFIDFIRTTPTQGEENDTVPTLPTTWGQIKALFP